MKDPKKPSPRPPIRAKPLGTFRAAIEIIGVNPFVEPPARLLGRLFRAAGRDRGKVPVRLWVDGHEFPQTLVRYAGRWRLYLNTPMRRAAGKEVGDRAEFGLAFDPEPRTIAAHPKLVAALRADPGAKAKFDALRPSLRFEIVRTLAQRKTEASVERNVARALRFLAGKERFLGRDPL